jgi:DNA-binding SARP family transcriptional activator
MLRPLGKAEAIAEPASARAGRDQKPENRAETPPPPEAVQIAVLGPLAITGGRKQRRKLRGATRELLAYLALHPNGAQRDQIIDALWPDQTPEQGRNRLWRAAADARNHLGETVISRDNDRYQLDRAQVSVDLDRLEELLSEISSDDHAETSLARLEDALKLFAGEPLAGLEFAWAESEQRRLQAVQLDLRERAGRLLLTTGDAASALAHAERGLSFEPYNEKLSRVAMEAEAALGLRKPVIQRYARLREILDEQLGLEPHTETKTLYRRLLAQDNADYPGHCDPDPVKGRR